MLPVEIQAVNGTLILRARGSELLILAHHVAELKGRKQPKDFTNYFMSDALINRPARKLFEAWLRKDNTLWQRIYNKVQKEMDDVLEAATPKAAKPVVGTQTASRAAASKEAPVEKAQPKTAKAPAKADKPVKAAKEAAKKEKEPAKETTKKVATTKKEAAKPAKATKTEKAKPAAATTKKTATKAAAKTTTAKKKTTTKSASKTAKKKK